ncbi:MAG: DUF4129 domain-containing protein, partial [Pseudomonadota bacterium]|nr:DUF4129 domain-containing protein [Pseudomonadota bacterium]
NTPSQTLLWGGAAAPHRLRGVVGGAAARLWSENPRAALALLYRGLLSILLHEFRLPLKTAHTEGEVLAAVHRLAQPQLVRFAECVTQHWQRQAYGHQDADETVRDRLCAEWRALFSTARPT